MNTKRDQNDIIEELIRAINKLRFGSIEVTVHDGRVVQIETREKLRFERPRS